MRTLVVVALPERKEKFPSSFVLFSFLLVFLCSFLGTSHLGITLRNISIYRPAVLGGEGGACVLCVSLVLLVLGRYSDEVIQKKITPLRLTDLCQHAKRTTNSNTNTHITTPRTQIPWATGLDFTHPHDK